MLFIVVYAWPILDPGMEPHIRRTCEIGNLLIWALFGVEYVIRLSLARRKQAFVRGHWSPSAGAGPRYRSRTPAKP